jgi:hypothetical protein
MKQIRLFSILTSAILFLNLLTVSAQEEKKSIRLSLSYSQINNQLPELTATAKSKNGKKFEAVEGIEVQFFLSEQSPGSALGKAMTNKKGIASIEIPVTVASKLDSLSPFKAVAFVAESKKFEEQTTETEITKARVELVLFEADSTRKVGAKLMTLKEGKWIETPGVEMRLFVRRLLSDLPIGENAVTTDDAGDVSADFKMTIPGDTKGNIIIGAKLDDNDTYGTIVAMKFAKWGVPQKADHSFYERSLWASRDKTPIWLLVFPNVIIVTVWGFIFYMVYLIFRIRKVGLEQ